MINDFNYMMFHQHLFGELNEFELAKRDEWYNSPGLDLLFQDYSGALGISFQHSLQLNSALQFIFLLPTILVLDLLFFQNSEIWVSLSPSGFSDLFTHCDGWVLLLLLGFSLLTLLRPAVQFKALTALALP